MATNRGTRDGDIEEINFVKDFNKNKLNSKFSILTKDRNINNLYMVRVTTNQLSTLSNTITKTRADSYLISSNDTKIKQLLVNNDFYLSEKIISNIEHEKITCSGISIKLQDSQKYQILKLTPNSFYNLFGNYELGAGASLFCLRNDELIKNEQLLVGWNTSAEKMKDYFSFLKKDEYFILNKEVCQQLKTYCNDKISELIDKSKELQQKIFNGFPFYKEPYTAWYVFANNQLKTLDYIPYSITTGSGRSHGDYTIVLKPKRED